MKCERCDAAMFRSEHHGSELLHLNCAVHNRRIRHECPLCGVTVTVVIPTVRTSGHVPTISLRREF
jgi:hypothetical protein